MKQLCHERSSYIRHFDPQITNIHHGFNEAEIMYLFYVIRIFYNLKSEIEAL